MAAPDRFRYLVASDWSECLSPNGPFDALIHTWPELEPDLTRIFSAYTSNEISLSSAVEKIKALLPGELSVEAMDAFLEEKFAAYANLSGLIQRCLERGIAFMINSTGPIGYFQRALAGGFVPGFPLLSAHPFLRYPPFETDPDHVFELFEIEDKGKNTQAALNALGIPPHRTAVLGDSGGDGPHFAWAAENGALRVGVNPKASLERYCAERGITIHARAGIAYSPGQPRDREAEAKTDLNEVCDILLRELPA
ncbi:MAG: hypothetical protein V5B78_09345 [Desulfohalobiaceae bacterium]